MKNFVPGYYLFTLTSPNCNVSDMTTQYRIAVQVIGEINKFCGETGRTYGLTTATDKKQD